MKKNIFRAILTAVGLLAADVHGQVTTSTAVSGMLTEPYGVVEDAANNIYIADSANNRIVRVDNATLAATTLAGIPGVAGFINGAFNVAQFNNPQGLLLVNLNGTSGLLVADSGNNSIRFVRLNDGYVSTLAGNGIAGAALNAAGTNATFRNPLGMDQDQNGNVYIADSGNNAIRVMNLSDPTLGVTNLLVSGGAFFKPAAVACVGTNQIWVADAGTVQNGSDNTIKLFTLSAPNAGLLTSFIGGNSTHLAGGYQDSAVGGTNVRFNNPRGLLWLNGIGLLISDTGNNVIRVATNNPVYGATNYSVTTYAGDGVSGLANGSAASSKFNSPFGLTPDLANNAFLVADGGNNVIRRVLTGITLPVVTPPFFNNPDGLAVDSSGGNLYIADFTNNAVQKLDFGNNLTTTYMTVTNGINRPASVLLDTNNNLYVLNQNAAGNGNILCFDPQRNLLATNATGLIQPTAFTLDASGNIFVAEQAGNLRVVYPSGAISTLVTITNSNVSLQGIALFDDGSIAVSDAGNHVLWSINTLTKTVSLLTGQPGNSGSTLGASNFALLNQPHQLARIGNNQLLLADSGNNRLVTVTRGGSVTNVLNATNASVWFGRTGDPANNASPKFVPMISPIGVAVSSAGLVYASETYYEDIRGLTTSLIAPAPVNVLLPAFITPSGLAFDPKENYLFIADPAANAVKLLNLNSNVTSTFLTALDGLSQPVSVLVDTNRYLPNIYVLNQNGGSNGSILAFDIYGNSYGTVASGLNQPTAFTEDGYGNIFVAEQSGSIRVFGAGVSNTIVAITNANVSLQGIAIFDDGAIAVSDAGNQVIWTIDALTKSVSLLTGQPGISGTTLGASAVAKLNHPLQLARAGNNQLLVADYSNNRLLTVTRNGYITNILNAANASVWFGQAGDPVTSGSAKFVPMLQPTGVAVGNGIAFVSEAYYEDVRGLAGSSVTFPLFNPGVPLPVYSSPAGIALNSAGNLLFVADSTNNTVSVLNLTNNQTTLFLNDSNGVYQPVDVALDSGDNLYVLNQGTGGNGSILKFDKFGNLLGTNAASLALPTAMKMSFAGDIYVSELNGAVQEFNAAGSNTLITITNANVQLEGIALLDNGAVVVSDAGNQVLWKIAPGATNVTLFTGVMGSTGTTLGAVGFAKLNTPMRLAQANGGLLLIVDSANNRVVVADDLGTISSVLNSANATLWFGTPIDPVNTSSPNFVAMLSPAGIAIGSAGTVFTSETTYKDVRGLLNTGIHAPIPPPPAPLNLVATSTYGQINLTWSAASSATNYNIRRSPSAGGPYSLVTSTSATSFTDNALGGSTYYYVVSAVNAGGESPESSEASAKSLIPPPQAPRIGWFEYLATPPFLTQLYPVTIVTFNNDQLLAIDPVTNGVFTYYIAGPAPISSVPSATNGSTPPFYQDNINFATPLSLTTVPDLMIKAINIDAIGQVSPVTTAEFIFQVANPNINGNNGAQFTVSDITTNSVLWYTVDGTDPTNASPSIGPIPVNFTNAATLSIDVVSNVLVKVRAFRDGYYPSGIAQQNFSSTNYFANKICFGFAAGPGSSQLVASPGQAFMAPVALTLLTPSPSIYSLQYNITVTNLGPNPVTPGAVNFNTLLWKPDPDNPGYFIPIPTFGFVSSNTIPPANDPSVILYQGDWFQNLQFTNTAENLLGVGWLEVYGRTNLYITKQQDLITYSFFGIGNSVAKPDVILGGYSFTVPINATTNDVYQIQIGRPSASGLSGPVDIAAPNDTNFVSPGSINALKNVTIGQLKYIVGSVYPGNWYNAGDFGSSNIINEDVLTVFNLAVYPVNRPPPSTDLFDAMDSCGGTYVDLGHGYLEFNSFISGPQATDPLFDGDDTSINQIAFGDGQLDICDVYVTYRRSLDPSLTWFRRFWSGGHRVADAGAPNVGPKIAVKPTVHSQAKTASTTPPQVNFMAGDFQGAAGQVVQIPITATIFGSYPLRLLMLNLTVEPLDGSPALDTPVQFKQLVPLGASYLSDSQGNGNYSAAWLNSTNAGLTGTVTLGNLIVTIPTGASTNAAYAIHFDHASASPNGLASFPKQTLSGLITLSSRTNSSYGDGIPDAWRLRWFGTVNNYLSLSNACPTSDGISNWKKFVAGVDPNTANDFPSTKPKTPAPSGSTTAIHWPSILGKQYAIERSTSLFSAVWSSITTNTGTGTDMEFDDNAAGSMHFYRVRILP